MKKRNILIHGVPEVSFYDALLQRKDVKKIYVTEFRPLLWGAKIVCKELLKRRLTPILICDNMVGFCLENKMINEVNIFAKAKDKEDLVCFVGSLVYAICASNNRVKVFVNKAAKLAKNPKDPDVLSFCGKRIASKGIKGYVPAWENVPLTLVFKSTV